MPNFDRDLRSAHFRGQPAATYPVLAGWNGYEALAIKSMDWTALLVNRFGGEVPCHQFVNNLAACEGSGDGEPSRRDPVGALSACHPDNEVAWKSEGLLAS